jgi:hypothetical protein
LETFKKRDSSTITKLWLLFDIDLRSESERSNEEEELLSPYGDTLSSSHRKNWFGE